MRNAAVEISLYCQENVRVNHRFCGVFLDSELSFVLGTWQAVCRAFGSPEQVSSRL